MKINLQDLRDLVKELVEDEIKEIKIKEPKSEVPETIEEKEKEVFEIGDEKELSPEMENELNARIQELEKGIEAIEKVNQQLTRANDEWAKLYDKTEIKENKPSKKRDGWGE